ncbi:hypothetical protein QE152_g27056 [Popillia japonica]|uniref:Uncharacterized protein n=1 Tax=Popillia japonica TaxID=7064 RepID=A0AAW1JVY9_POPJA
MVHVVCKQSESILSVSITARTENSQALIFFLPGSPAVSAPFPGSSSHRRKRDRASSLSLPTLQGDTKKISNSNFHVANAVSRGPPQNVKKKEPHPSRVRLESKKTRLTEEVAVRALVVV